MLNLRFQHNHFSDTKAVSVILHGGGSGLDSEFMQKIATACNDRQLSNFAFDCPYITRGEETSSGDELAEELAALDEVLSHLKGAGYEQINFIAKSFGGILLARYLQRHPEFVTPEITILGLVVGDADFSNFPGKLTVIQGELDRFGDISQVQEALADAVSEDINLLSVVGGDHSYKDAAGEPTHQGEAISLIFAPSEL